MMLRLSMTVATVLALTSGAAYASLEFPTSTDEARAAAALANPRSTSAAGGYDVRPRAAVQTRAPAYPTSTDEARAAAARATSTSKRVAGGYGVEQPVAVAAAQKTEGDDSGLPECCRNKAHMADCCHKM